MALSPLKNKQIEAFHDKGLTVKEIGRKTHCSHAEIRQLLKSKGKEPIEEKKPQKKMSLHLRPQIQARKIMFLTNQK